MVNVEKMIKSFEYVDLRKKYVVEKDVVRDEDGVAKNLAVVKNSLTGETITSFYFRYYPQPIFEPFRVWSDKEECWRNFAVFSSDYVGLQIVDLDHGGCSTRNITDQFCLTEVFIPDLFDYIGVSDKEFESVYPEDDSFGRKILEETFLTFYQRRTFGFVKGCFWGDDWSDKLRTIDLQKTVQNFSVADTAEKFGYFVYGENLHTSMKDSNDYFFDKEYRYLLLNTTIDFRLDENAQVSHSSFFSGEIPPCFNNNE